MTAPPTPPDCDLRDFPFMPIDAARLFGSEFHAVSTDAEWRAGVTLWLKSWHQVPAASLPDDDVMLCRLAELGRDVKAWRRVRDGALRGWIKCDDGRLYHPVVAQKAAEAWERKSAYRNRTAAARQARLQKREAAATGSVTETVEGSVTEPVGGSVTATRGTGTGTGTIREERDEAKASGAVAPLIDLDAKAWSETLRLLTGPAGAMREGPARTLVGKWVRDLGGEAKALIPLVAAAETNGTMDPKGYLTAAVARKAKGRIRSDLPLVGGVPDAGFC